MANDGAPRVVVLGAGFAGLRAVRHLARAGIQTTWVDRHNYHLFLPLLYQVATAGLEPQEIAYPARNILRGLAAAEFKLAHVASGDPERRTLTTTTGETIPYDWLIVATGCAAEDFGIPGVRDHAFQLYTLEDARRLRNHVMRALELAASAPDSPARTSQLTFVVVGGGPTGVETAGAMAELRRHLVPRDYRLRAEDVRIVLLEAADDVLLTFPPALRSRAQRDLRALGVDVRLGAKVACIAPDGVTLADGSVLPARTVIWAAGMRASAIAATLGLPTGRSGRLVVEPTLQVNGHPRVFVAGDVALIESTKLPQVAQVAMQQGVHAARNVLRAIDGEPLEPFVYSDKGSMAVIGRSRAVAVIGESIHLEGFIAWWAWLLIHIVMLIGVRNRLRVLIDWAWSYLVYDPGARAIVGADPQADEPDLAGLRPTAGATPPSRAAS